MIQVVELQIGMSIDILTNGSMKNINAWDITFPSYFALALVGLDIGVFIEGFTANLVYNQVQRWFQTIRMYGKVNLFGNIHTVSLCIHFCLGFINMAWKIISLGFQIRHCFPVVCYSSCENVSVCSLLVREKRTWGSSLSSSIKSIW